MAQKNKKSRFGNPAKAAADAAARGKVAPSSADERLQRAMESLAPGFVAWLEEQSRPNKSIDTSLLILDDFFDMYRIIEPKTDPTALVPEAVAEVMEVTAHANPLGVLTLRAGVRDYVNYLAHATLWTGSADDLAAIQAELARTGRDTEGFDADVDEELAVEDYEFAEVYIPELTQEETLQAVFEAPLWKNAMALLDWIGDGKDLTADRTLQDSVGAAATLTHSGLGVLSEASKFTTPEEHDGARLGIYLEMLDVAGLITVGDSQIYVTKPVVDASADEDDIIATMRELIGLYIFSVTLEGSEEGDYEYWQLEMSDWLTQSSSENPPEAAPIIQALSDPESVHPDLLAIAQNIAFWAEEGLVTVGEFIEVPPIFRADVFEMLSDDLPVNAVGPGAAFAE
ncbi:hypothetical protein CVS30_06595 [Arthrobacter psychrolactophilus]|uniref:Uncharacterized protein n=1 Tax=Arthrobacter psychrolactophilus TaxID=92442 RepID=A0A2V5IR02_9MICC|nr:hypothetical protein [Arthrobacter psychrolactophilus]PYI38978.1 hypothetical protein CVS30_06595 [Arthrobacter psychrolactophilus]